MSIWASWESVGETVNEKPDWSVLSYKDGFSNWYPRRRDAKPASIDLAHIPGFVWRAGMPKCRRDQTDDTPVAPYLRLGVAADNHMDLSVETFSRATAVLTVRAVENLRDNLNYWLGLERHRR